jgi:hypothetical protein
MSENLMLSEIDPGGDESLTQNVRKWGGRIVLGAIMTHYVRSSYIHLKNNPIFKRVEEAIHHHEHEETDIEQ